MVTTAELAISSMDTANDTFQEVHLLVIEPFNSTFNNHDYVIFLHR